MSQNSRNQTIDRQNLPVVPLSSAVLFPGSLLRLEVEGETWAKLVAELGRHREQVVAVTERSAGTLHEIGVLADVVHIIPGDEAGRFSLVLAGLSRRRVGAVTQLAPFLRAETEPVDETAFGADVEALTAKLRASTLRLLALSPDVPPRAAQHVTAIESPSGLADTVATHLDVPVADRQALLAELDVATRLGRVLVAVDTAVAKAEQRNARAKIEAEDAADPNLREQILRERLKKIQEELGEESEDAGVDELAEKLAAAKLPPEADAAARRELRRLRTMGESPERQVARTYLEWLVELPWSKRTEDKLDLAAARAVLDADHDGLEKIKQRVVEYLAVRKLRPNKKGPILLFVGPPGVGKTSLGKSIAKALGREYVRVSLGGVRDESEIRGHRRTYIGALPGRIIQGLKRAGTKNPVFVLDEIDKLASDFRGDPASALLEVLDPEQNGTFSDHYVEVPFDLSEVIFLATANDLGPIAAPLRDRMEIISIPGYTRGEKQAIATRHLVPRQLSEHGLSEAHASFTPGAIDAIVDGYTAEAGVRNLERELASVIRGVGVRVAAGETYKPEIDVADVPSYLGPARFDSDVAEETQVPGVATGLAWTPVGGEVLFIEATRMPGHGKLSLTGQLGEVMRESAQAALSYVRSHAAELGVDPDVFATSDVHLHVPAGGTPKDGPSAGNAILSALVSLFTGRRVRGDVAMTGEITLRGHVLPVGGIASKVLAAHRAGIKRVVLPSRNAKDLSDLPAEVRAALDIVLVKRVDETLRATLEPAAAPSLPLVIPPPTPPAALTGYLAA